MLVNLSVIGCKVFLPNSLTLVIFALYFLPIGCKNFCPTILLLYIFLPVLLTPLNIFAPVSTIGSIIFFLIAFAGLTNNCFLADIKVLPLIRS